MEDIEIQDVDDRVETGQWIDCPHCSEKILVGFKSKVWIQRLETVTNDGHTSQPRDKVKTWQDSLSGKQSAVLDEAKRTGLLDCFVHALERGPHDGMPNNKEKYFLGWLQHCKPRIIPEWALNEFRELYPKKYIEFYGHGFVGAVCADSEFSLFLPINLINGISIKQRVSGEKRMGTPDVSGVRQWIRTRMGYVPAGKGAFVDEMKKKSYGEFANPVL